MLCLVSSILVGASRHSRPERGLGGGVQGLPYYMVSVCHYVAKKAKHGRGAASNQVRVLKLQILHTSYG